MGSEKSDDFLMEKNEIQNDAWRVQTRKKPISMKFQGKLIEKSLIFISFMETVNYKKLIFLKCHENMENIRVLTRTYVYYENEYNLNQSS